MVIESLTGHWTLMGIRYLKEGQQIDLWSSKDGCPHPSFLGVEIKCEKQEVKKMEKNQPEKKFKAGAISATVWLNKSQGKEGEIAFRTISLERVYKDKEGSWQNTTYLRINDLPKATIVLQKAYEYLTLRESVAN